VDHHRIRIDTITPEELNGSLQKRQLDTITT
jgi:hypothetical protein